VNAQEYREYLLREAQIAGCWIIVEVGLFGLFIVQVTKDTGFRSPWTWVFLAVFLMVGVAGIIDDRYIRGCRNRKIRTEHAHLRKRNKN
jgi:UDP-N-acetylmuramyl pentapeptide phosphotransferase/UDP-N-acetylglucosamine-1-phosphate transferase